MRLGRAEDEARKSEDEARKSLWMRLGRAEDDVTGNIPAKVLHVNTITS